jgi:IS6 family transposase
MTVYRWVWRFTPLLVDAPPRPCHHAVGDRWHLDETYLKVSGTWRYLYRATDQFGQVVDVLLSTKRHAGAARRFFTRAIAETRTEPAEVATDRVPAYLGVSTNCSPPPSTTWSSTPTTSSRPTTAGSSLGCDRCAV